MSDKFPFQKFLGNLEHEKTLERPKLLITPSDSDVKKNIQGPAPISSFKKEKKQIRPRSAKEVSFSLLSSFQETTDDLEDKAKSQYLGHIHSNSTTSIIDKTKTFDNFIVGPSNNLTFATVQSVAEAPSKKGKYPSLYIYSCSGLGKTHLLHALANDVANKFPSIRICLISAREFMKEMIEAIRKKHIEVFQDRFTKKTDILMIDDIHELKNKEGTQNEFFHIFNELHSKGKQLIFTSDKPPKEIDGIEDRIKTRFQWGLVLDIQRPDFETRMAILRKKAQELDLFLQEDVIVAIASSFKSSIRELEGSLIRLSAYEQVMNAEIDLELTKNLLGIGPRNAASNITDNHEQTFTIEAIARIIAHHYKLPLVDLRARVRGRQVSLARHIGMYLSRKLTVSTHKEIGQFYGNRDHTSVLRAIIKVEKILDKDPHFSEEISCIELLLKE